MYELIEQIFHFFFTPELISKIHKPKFEGPYKSLGGSVNFFFSLGITLASSILNIFLRVWILLVKAFGTQFQWCVLLQYLKRLM